MNRMMTLIMILHIILPSVVLFQLVRVLGLGKQKLVMNLLLEWEKMIMNPLLG